MKHGAETDADYKKLIFRYNADGLRVQKEFIHKVGAQLVTEVTKYTLHGKNVVHMTRGNDEVHFWYDAQNRPAMVDFNGAKYTYIHNLQGDIVGILDSNGAEVVKYMYDAWGKQLGNPSGTMATTLGQLQPFRYRGYVYDEEIAMYYLRSRYYYPVRCQFINADQVNLIFFMCRVDNCFEYCHNCPSMYVDYDGNASKSFDLGQGWHWRIDPTNSNGKIQKHIHIWKDGGESYAQNEDGSVHEGQSGNPPKWIQKKLRDTKKWNWKDRKSAPGNSTPSPSNSPTPSPNPTPAPGPAPVFVPDSDDSTSESTNVSIKSNQQVSNALVSVVVMYWVVKLLSAVPSGGLTLAIP